MSRRSTRGQTTSGDTSKDEKNNILHVKRGSECNYICDASLNKRRQKELLQTSSSVQPTCVDFGLYREEQYPDHLFCNNCNLWDNWCPENKRLHSSMKNSNVQQVIRVLMVQPRARKVGIKKNGVASMIPKKNTRKRRRGIETLRYHQKVIPTNQIF